MAYEKTNWVSTTPINTINLNKIEDGIEQNSNDVGDLTTLNTIEKSNLVGAINELNNAEVLYEGEGVSTGTITLEKSLNDYEYIDIFYENQELHYCTRVYNPDGKKIGLFSASVESSLLQVDNNYIELSDTTITFGTGRRTNITSSIYSWTTNNQSIYRIVGYK